MGFWDQFGEELARRERQRKDEARWRPVEQGIERKEGAGRDLDALEKAGVPRKKMLRLLAVTADALKDRRDASTELIRDKRDELRGLAKRMDALAHKIDKALDDPLLKLPWWVYLVGSGSLLGMEMPHPKPWRDDPGVFLGLSGLRALAWAFREEAKKFGRFLRAFGRKDAQAPVALLLLSVYFMRFRQGGVRKLDHFLELANLLTDAIEVAGINKYGRARPTRRSERGEPSRKDECFSADGLRKVWKGRGKPLLRFWLLNFRARQSEKPEPPTLPPIKFAAPLTH